MHIQSTKLRFAILSWVCWSNEPLTSTTCGATRHSFSLTPQEEPHEELVLRALPRTSARPQWNNLPVNGSYVPVPDRGT